MSKCSQRHKYFLSSTKFPYAFLTWYKEHTKKCNHYCYYYLIVVVVMEAAKNYVVLVGWFGSNVFYISIHLLFPFYTGRNWGKESFNDLPKGIELLRKENGISVQVIWAPESMLLTAISYSSLLKKKVHFNFVVDIWHVKQQHLRPKQVHISKKYSGTLKLGLDLPCVFWSVLNFWTSWIHFSFHVIYHLGPRNMGNIKTG